MAYDDRQLLLPGDLHRPAHARAGALRLNNDKSVIREVKRVSASLVDSTLKNANGAAVDLATLIAADFAARIPGGATLAASSFADITQLLSDPNMPGLFYAIVGVHGVPNLWMTVTTD